MNGRKKVFVSQRLPEPLPGMLGRHFDVETHEADDPIRPEALCEKIRGVDAIVVSAWVPLPAEVIACAGPNLKAIVNYSVGYNNIDVAAATEKKIMVTNTPDVLTDATATLAWSLLLAVARRIGESERLMRTGHPWHLSPCDFWGCDVTGRTLGVVGAGRIGASFAMKSRGFDMKVLYHDEARNETLERELGAQIAGFDALLAESDFVSLHVPYLPSTHHLIDERALGLMKPTAVLVNTSRGPIVDERALARALKEGQIWGAGIDVFENEPIVTPELFDLDNVVMTPHIASATPESRQGMARIAAECCIAALTGRRPRCLVNPEVWG